MFGEAPPIRLLGPGHGTVLFRYHKQHSSFPNAEFAQMFQTLALDGLLVYECAVRTPRIYQDAIAAMDLQRAVAARHFGIIYHNICAYAPYGHRWLAEPETLSFDGAVYNDQRDPLAGREFGLAVYHGG